MRMSSTDVISAIASTDIEMLITTQASQPVSMPLFTAPQRLPSGKSAAAMPV